MTVSVILTSYNHEKYISSSIESILNQTYSDFQLIILDDCSQDGSWEIIQKYTEDSRVLAIQNEKNLGARFTKEVMDLVEGKYFAIAHSDDTWEEDKLEKQVDYLESNPEVGACFTKVRLIDEEGNDFLNKDHAYGSVFEQENRSRFEWLSFFFYFGNCLCHPSVMLRMEYKDIYVTEPEGLASLPDFYKWIQLCCRCEIYILPERVTCFRVRSGSANTSGDKAENWKRGQFETIIMLKAYKNVKNQDDFLKVFPYAQKYVVDGKIDISFAFAKLLLEQEGRRGHQLVGLMELYNLLNTDEKRVEIEKIYGYTSLEFYRDSGIPDIFGAISNDKTMKSILSLERSNDKTESIVKELFVAWDGSFFVDYALSEIEGNQTWKRIRFFAERLQLRDFKDVVILLDDKSVSYISNAIGRKDGWLKFDSLYPEFEVLTFKEPPKKISIYGKTRIQSMEEITEKLEKYNMEGFLRIKENENSQEVVEKMSFQMLDNNCFEAICCIPEKLNGKQIKSIVFETTPGKMADFASVKFYVDEKRVHFRSNAACEKEGWLLFQTVYPFFVLDVSDMACSVVKVIGKVRMKDLNEIEHLLNSKSLKHKIEDRLRRDKRKSAD